MILCKRRRARQDQCWMRFRPWLRAPCAKRACARHKENKSFNGEVSPLRRQLPPHCMHANVPTVLFQVRSVRPAASQLQAPKVMRNLPFPPLGNSIAHTCVILPDRFKVPQSAPSLPRQYRTVVVSEGAPLRLRARHWNQRKAPA